MSIIVSITIILLFSIGLIHFYWAFGGKIGLNNAIPSKNEKALLNPPKVLTFIVGIVIIGFAYVSYILEFEDLNSFVYKEYFINITWILVALFFVRAVGDFYVVGFFKKIKNSNFANYDTKYYSPLCLMFSIVFFLQVYKI